jgi:hypothetical protein
VSIYTGDVVGIGLVVLSLVGLWSIGRRLRRVRVRRARRTRSWRWFIWFGGVLLLSAGTAWAQDTPQQAYITGNPANASWLGLATLHGRYAIQLGDACGDVVGGVNVLTRSDGANLTLQVVGPTRGMLELVCTIVNIVRTGETPCATNPDGLCDYAYS